MKKESPKKVHVHASPNSMSLFTGAPAFVSPSLIISFSRCQSGGGGSWLKWFYGKGKKEAHLPDDNNKSVGFFFLSFSVFENMFLIKPILMRMFWFFLSDCLG